MEKENLNQPNITENNTSQPVSTPELTPTPNIPTNQSKPRPIKLIAFAFLIIFIVLVIFLSGYIFAKNQTSKQITQTPSVTQTPSPSPTIDPTEDWKTYTNKEKGYSFKFPPSWTTRETEGSVTVSSNIKYPESPNDTEPITYWVFTEYLDNPKKLEFKDLATNDYKDLKDSFNYSSDNIKGNTAYRTTSLPSQLGCEWVYFPDKNNGLVGLVFCAYDKNKPFKGQDENYKIFNQILSTFKFTNLNSQESAQKYLEIKEYGIKIPLSDAIEDAYYYTKYNKTDDITYVYLRVHSLDSESYCNDNYNMSLAALNKVGKDEIDQRSGNKYSDSGNGMVIGNYYYFIDLSQAVCSQKTSNQTVETNARKGFSEASKNITTL